MIDFIYDRELHLILKHLQINYNDEIISGELAFKKLVIDHDLLGKSYIINFERTPITIDILDN